MLASKSQLMAAMKPEDKIPEGSLATKEQLMAAMSPGQSLGSEIWQGAKDVVGGLGRGILDAPSTMLESSPVPKILRAIGQADKSPATMALANPFESIGRQLPGKESDLLYKVGRFAPAVAGGVRSAYDVGSLGIRGAKGAKEALSRMLGTNADEKANDLAKIISENKNARGVNADLAEHLRTEHAVEKAHAADRFNKTFKEADYMGYGKDATKSPRKLSLKNFSKNMEKLPLDADREIHGYKVAERLDKFKENPTFENAHRLQSRLGNIERRLSKSPDQIAKDKAIAVKKVKDSLLDDIKGTFKRNGHKELWEKYSGDRAHYKNNVGIFNDNNIIGKTIGGLGQPITNPSNLVGALMKDNESVNAVVNKLPDYVKDKMALLNMKTAIKEMPGQGIKTTAKELLDKYRNLGSTGFNTEIISPNFRRGMDEIEHAVARSGKLKASRGKIKNYGIAAGSLGGIGYGAKELYDLLG